jgi:hypothetical protein
MESQHKMETICFIAAMIALVLIFGQLVGCMHEQYNVKHKEIWLEQQKALKEPKADE